MGSVSASEQDYAAVALSDPDVHGMLQAEEDRQQNTLELIASENHVSRAVRQAVGSVFTNKYAEGYPGRRYYGGCRNMDAAEDHVHVCFYIWLADNNGLKVAAALERAAKRGVACRAMADNLGSRAMIASEHWKAMGKAGVKLGVALPIGNLLLRPFLLPFKGRLDLRNHRKNVVIDGRITYCGSQNCADPEFRAEIRDMAANVIVIEHPPPPDLGPPLCRLSFVDPAVGAFTIFATPSRVVDCSGGTRVVLTSTRRSCHSPPTWATPRSPTPTGI